MSLSYKLALALKEAGYKQPDLGVRATNISGQGFEGVMSNGVEENIKNGDNIYKPTLSELIEACGDRFFAIYTQKKKWICVDKKLSEGFEPFSEEKVIGKEVFFGNTPEEAIANLWLRLNAEK